MASYSLLSVVTGFLHLVEYLQVSSQLEHALTLHSFIMVKLYLIAWIYYILFITIFLMVIWIVSPFGDVVINSLTRFWVDACFYFSWIYT